MRREETLRARWQAAAGGGRETQAHSHNLGCKILQPVATSDNPCTIIDEKKRNGSATNEHFSSQVPHASVHCRLPQPAMHYSSGIPGDMMFALDAKNAVCLTHSRLTQIAAGCRCGIKGKGGMKRRRVQNSSVHLQQKQALKAVNRQNRGRGGTDSSIRRRVQVCRFQDVVGDGGGGDRIMGRVHSSQAEMRQGRSGAAVLGGSLGLARNWRANMLRAVQC